MKEEDMIMDEAKARREVIDKEFIKERMLDEKVQVIVKSAEGDVVMDVESSIKNNSLVRQHLD